ncbi:Conjugative transposon protein TcpC [Mycobacteroides abscessus subsp. abscessus]|uniref:hypothetical protein n=1 Tax=Mycobacteroides abscessus TaxID=36809 RepID=UPI0009A83F64|nr:hypothetical protein [Mycobacteroides abscessus]SLJ66931.1 Conjugative transposon protein TcpC [Mycobacteroides abscessus subsp. abscessus]
MKISNAWKKRLSAGGNIGKRVGFVALVAFSSISGLDAAKRYIWPPEEPPIVPITQTVINESDRVKGFAIGCVESLLSGSIIPGVDIANCYPDGVKYTPAGAGSKTVTGGKAVATKFGPSTDDISVYGVQVIVDEQSYAGAPKTTAKYQITVSVYQHDGLQAVDKIGTIPLGPPGAYLPLGYPVDVPRNQPNSTELTPLFSSLQGFATAFLTNAGGLDRYTTPDSGITALGTYTLATITAAAADSTPADNPADNAELAVHIDVSARRPDYSQEALSYPLTLRASGGSWFIASIDAIPVLGQLKPIPAPAPTAQVPVASAPESQASVVPR